MNRKLKRTNLGYLSHYSKNNKEEGIDLAIGEGHFNSSFNAKLKAHEALLNNQTRYGQVEGVETLRKVIIEKYYPNYNYQNEVVITNGSTQAFFIVMLSLINKGDEIILLSPHYAVYENVIKLLGGVPVIIDTSKTNFKINTETLEKHLTNKTKALIISEPNNPTGITYTTQEKVDLLKYLSNKKMYIVVDELYRLYTRSEFVSFSEIILDQELRNKYIFINGLSKSHLMTGYRIGFVISNGKINEELKKINFLNVGCISTIMQEGAIGAILDEEYTKFVTNYYLNNLEILKDSLTDLNVEFVNATGAYYLFINVEKYKLSGEAFCQIFKERYQTTLVPGNLFGNYYQNYIRISCCRDIIEIIKFINYFKLFLQDLNNKKQ